MTAHSLLSSLQLEIRSQKSKQGGVFRAIWVDMIDASKEGGFAITTAVEQPSAVFPIL